LLGLSRLGAAAVGRARADAVADMVALAGVTAGPEGAARVASASGARLVEHHEQADGSVRVSVQLGSTGASAAAAPVGAPLTGDPDPQTGRR
jgi:precorrin-3B methylase